MTNKEKYTEFCNNVDFVPIFSQPWWMDAVSSDGSWDVIIHEKDTEIIGALPFFVKKKYGLSYVTQPRYTQNNGVVIKYPNNQRYEKRLSFEKEIMVALIDQLEKKKFIFYRQSFNCTYTNWLPFYWRGYKQTTLYTYRITDISNIDNVISLFDSSKRSDLKNALKHSFSFNYQMPIERFIEHMNSTFLKRGEKLYYPLSLVKQIYIAAKLHNSVSIISVEDENRNIHSAIFLVWDKNCAYNLITSIDPDYRNSRSTIALFVKAIEFASKKVNIFDFEGSMNESIELSYRKLGTVQTPYFNIHKVYIKNRIARLIVESLLNI